MQNEAHELLCELGRSHLEKRRFIVEMNKRIYHPVIKRQRRIGNPIDAGYFVLDVYGEREGEIIMYECGNCEQERLDWLRKYIGKTIHMPYLTQWFPTYFPREYVEGDLVNGRKERLSEKPRKRAWWP